ncbi:MAG: rRNA maturation RNase YbeY [Thermoleophilia bacterium]|jgi:probable rRNA maturation factor
MSGAQGLEVAMDNRSGLEIDLESAALNATTVMSHLGIKKGELGLSFVSVEEMTQLNRMHMDREGPTDVLSFAIDVYDPLWHEETESGVPVLLGDVVICPEVAREQAVRLDSTFEDEICLLLIHGILHIAGHDHETDAGEMERLQDDLFGRFCS